MLNTLGLDATAESVYRELLRHPEDGVADLSRRLHLSEEEVRLALDRLSELALVHVSAEEPHLLQAVSPRLGMEMLLAGQQAALAAQQQRVESGRLAAARLISEFSGQRTGTAGTDVLHLEGVAAVRHRLAEISDEVTEEFWTSDPGGPRTAADVWVSRPLNGRLRERGVTLRTLCLDSVRNDPRSVAHAEWPAGQGGQVRTVPFLPSRMILCDRRVAIVAQDAGDTAAGAIVLRTPGVVSALVALFESTWQTARPLGAPVREDPDELTPQQCEALRLLAQGCTDQTIAKRLGFSARTARRIATDLMSRLQARSRFQAGVQAVQRGYLPASPD